MVPPTRLATLCFDKLQVEKASIGSARMEISAILGQISRCKWEICSLCSGNGDPFSVECSEEEIMDLLEDNISI